MTSLSKRALLSALITILVLAYGYAQTMGNSGKDDNLRSLARQSDGLHKAALANKGFYEHATHKEPPRYRMPDLASLAKSSSLIVAAKIGNNQSLLIDDGRTVVTDYNLITQHTFKGSSIQQIHLVVPGGTYRFSDGSVVSQVEDLHKPLKSDREYILFLKPAPDNPNEYHLTSVGQAVFEVGSDGEHMSSRAYSKADKLHDEANAGKTAFVQKLESIVAAESRN